MLWFSPENLFKYSFITCYKSARNALNAVNAGCIFQVFEQKHKNSFSLHSINFFINLKTHYNCFSRCELSCLFASEWICSAFPLRCTQCSLLLCLYWRSQGRYESIMMICIYNNINVIVHFQWLRCRILKHSLKTRNVTRLHVSIGVRQMAYLSVICWHATAGT